MFRNRKLDNKSDKFEYNVWDNVSLPEKDISAALQKINIDLNTETKQKYEQSMESWEIFYNKHNDNFFKDRKWIEQEFNELADCKRILEIGCGVGNSLSWLHNKNHFDKEKDEINKINKGDKFYVKDKFYENVKVIEFYKHDDSDEKIEFSKIDKSNNIDTFNNPKNKTKNTNFVTKQEVYGCDFSEKAIQIAQKRLCNFHFFVHDISSKNPISHFDFDAVILIFTLSAINPENYNDIFLKIKNVLKVGGKIFFKDYSYLDMIQLRYKNDQIVNENFYRRSDGTYTYFFEIDKLRELVENNGFYVESLFEDRRLKINRKTKVEMYRIMLQGIFTKL
ncbi:Methyltransferase-like protein 2-A [Gurleya vavrai]